MHADILINSPKARQKADEAMNRRMSREFCKVALVTIVHLPLGLVLYKAGSLAILHPAIVFVVGVLLALNRRVPLFTVLLVVGYIVGAEVLWRMADIPIFWESGKYMAASIMIIALLNRDGSRIPPTPLVYFVLLLPSCFLALDGSSFSGVSQTISFNMSGPFLLLVCCWFFNSIRLRPFELRPLLIVMILPLLSVALTTLFYTVTNENLQFTGESNYETSGGFGPNQVSSMLGLGVFLSLAGVVLSEKRSRFGIYFAVSALFMAALSVMTFSRGGLYNAIGASVALILLQFQDPSAGLRRVALPLILAMIFLVLIFPALNTFTGGALEARFEDTNTTNRWEIVVADMQLFLENPLVGVGLGESKERRTKFLGFGAASHTEFSRLLAEHGILGVAAIAVLVVIAVVNLRRIKSVRVKALIGGAIAWSFLYMTNAGMRLAAPSFMVGLAFLTIGSARTSLVSRVNDRRKSKRRLEKEGKHEADDRTFQLLL